MALPNDWITWLPVELAQTLGYTQQEGITLSVSETNGLGKAMEALLGGSVQVAAGTLAQSISLAAEGRRPRCIVGLYTRPAVAVVVAPPMTTTIRTVRDLVGRRVGVASAGSASHQFLEFLLVSQGLTPQAVQPVSVGTAAETVRRYVAAYNDKVRNTHVDLSHTYTNDFVSGR
jgi:NitT/TauT family transport system substrate-binding protein